MKTVRAIVALALACLSFSAAALDLGFDRLEKQLRIRPEQKAQYDAAVGATQRALLAVALTGMRMKERLEQEIDKPWPDFLALVREQQEAADELRPLFREARDEWSKLCDELDDDQLDIARRFMRERLDRLLR